MRTTAQPPTRWLRSFVFGGRPPAGGDALVELPPQVPLREIFRRFWPAARPYRWGIALTLVMAVVSPMLDAAVLWLFKILIDDVLVPRDFAAFPPLAAAYIGIMLVDGVLSYVSRILSTYVTQGFLLDLRTQVFTHIQSLSLDFFERRRLGDTLSRLNGDVAAIETLLLGGVSRFLGYVAKILIFGGLLFYLNWKLALVAVAATPVFALIARRFSRLIKDASREKRRRSGSISAVAEESIGNAALVQAYGREAAEVDRFHEQNLAGLHATMAATRLRALYGPLVDTVELVGTLLIIGAGTYELSRGRLTMGELLVFLGYLSALFSPVRGMGRLSNTVQSASAGAERLIDLLEQKAAVREPASPRRLRRARGRISLEGVSFRYPETSQEALKEISFEVEPGQTLAVVGASGAGKSTLSKLLLRFYDPTTGAVRLDGIDLRELSLADLRANVATVMQDGMFLDLTVRENILWGRPDADESEVVEAARAADAHDFVMALPEGYHTRVGQRGRRLSGGQRQRIAIARAMIRDAPVLLLDEPTTGLDAASSARVLAPMRRLMSGRTTVVISHNLLTVRDADAIVVLESGRVVESGDHVALLAADGLYARLYRLHQPDVVTAMPSRKERTA